MKVKLIQADLIEELKDELAEICNSNFIPTVAVVFASVKHNLHEISELFNKYNIALFGGSSSGEIIQDETYEESIAVMLLDIKKENFDIFIKSKNSGTIKDTAEQARIYALEKFENPGIIVMASGLDSDGDEIVETLREFTKKPFPVFGGLTGDDLQMKSTYVFSNNKVISNGLICLILNNDKIKITGTATSGWETIGIEKTITKSVGNIVYSIENEPALDFFLKYYNIEIDLENKNDIITKIGAKYPVQLIRDSGKRVLRAALFTNPEDNSLIFAGRVPQGAKVKFSVPPSFDLIEKTINNIENLKQITPNADAIIMFSCVGRKDAMGPLIEDEIEGIRKLWDLPQIGFFTYGEIGSSQGAIPDFHNETCCLVLLEEK